MTKKQAFQGLQDFFSYSTVKLPGICLFVVAIQAVPCYNKHN